MKKFDFEEFKCKKMLKSPTEIKGPNKFEELKKILTGQFRSADNEYYFLELEHYILTHRNTKINCVYYFINNYNHKIYIGSSGNPSVRFDEHLFCNDLDNFHRDLNNSIKNFDFKIQYVAPSRYDAYIVEGILINEEYMNNKQYSLYNKIICKKYFNKEDN